MDQAVPDRQLYVLDNCDCGAALMAGYQALPDGSEGAYGRLVANIEGQLHIITQATAAVRGGIGHSSDSVEGHAV